MFERKENGHLYFNRLEFEVMIQDCLETTPPKNKNDLEWMTRQMLDSLQLAVWEYANENLNLEDEWEDLYLPL